MSRCLICFNFLAYCTCPQGQAQRHGEAARPRWHTLPIPMPRALQTALGRVGAERDPEHHCRYCELAAVARMN